MLAKDSYCSWCGSPHQAINYPKECGSCKNITFRNPPAVSAAIVMIDGGLLIAKRGIEPNYGEWTLPGGYLEFGEDWKVGVVRELREETGVVAYPDEVKLFDVMSSPTHTLIFGLINHRFEIYEIDGFKPNEETLELKVIYEPEDLAFPSHTAAVTDFFTNFRGLLT